MGERFCFFLLTLSHSFDMSSKNHNIKESNSNKSGAIRNKYFTISCTTSFKNHIEELLSDLFLIEMTPTIYDDVIWSKTERPDDPTASYELVISENGDRDMKVLTAKARGGSIVSE
eukprot:1010983_1